MRNGQKHAKNVYLLVVVVSVAMKVVAEVVRSEKSKSSAYVIDKKQPKNGQLTDIAIRVTDV